MPEGDTIHKAAVRIRAVLGTGPLTRFDTPRPVAGPRPEPGEGIDAIRARGKHLLITFAGGATLHTHLGMNGSWRIDRPGGAAGRGHDVRVTMEAPGGSARCLHAPVVELLDAAALRRHPILRALGPDLCEEDPDLDEALARMRTLDQSTPVGLALLDQRVAAGIGNVYRSEVLWLCATHPLTPLASVPEPTRCDLLREAHRQLRRNLGPGPRRTVAQGLAVYERAGRPCLRCGAPIEVRRLGEQARAAWWCPACQTRP